MPTAQATSATRPALKRNDPRHGTTNGYANHGCRCTRCQEAWATACRERKRKRVPPPMGDPRHGKVNCYAAYNCRCVLCRAANAADKRERDYRRKYGG